MSLAAVPDFGCDFDVFDLLPILAALATLETVSGGCHAITVEGEKKR